MSLCSVRVASTRKYGAMARPSLLSVSIFTISRWTRLLSAWVPVPGRYSTRNAEPTDPPAIRLLAHAIMAVASL